MKFAEVPAWAYDAPATPVPTKVVPDWDALYQQLLEQGFVIIESEETRTLSTGAVECVLVKNLNSHVRLTKKKRLQTKRIGHKRWFCTL